MLTDILRKVQVGKLAVNLFRLLVACASGFFGRLKPPKVMGYPIGDYFCYPNAIYKDNADVSGLIADVQPSVPGILRSGALTEVPSPVVEAIAINMVNFDTICSGHNQSVHTNLPLIDSGDGVEDSRIIGCAPSVTPDKSDVLFVNLRKSALAQANQIAAKIIAPFNRAILHLSVMPMDEPLAVTFPNSLASDGMGVNTGYLTTSAFTRAAREYSILNWIGGIIVLHMNSLRSCAMPRGVTSTAGVFACLKYSTGGA